MRTFRFSFRPFFVWWWPKNNRCTVVINPAHRYYLFTLWRWKPSCDGKIFCRRIGFSVSL